MEERDLQLLRYVSTHGGVTLRDAGRALGLSSRDAQSTLDRLEHDKLVKVERRRVRTVRIMAEANRYIDKFPEEELRDSLLVKGRKPDDIRNSIALGWAVKNGWAIVSEGLAKITQAGRESVGRPYKVRELLIKLKDAQSDEQDRLVRSEADAAETLVKRKLIAVEEGSIVEGIAVTREGEAALGSKTAKDGHEIGQLSKELLLSKGWKGMRFKSYNVNAPSETVYPARLHPMHQLLDKVRRIWLDMGFTEVEGPIIESAFWNFDALFSPQDHPTREMQDTFYLAEPKSLDIGNRKLVARVKAMHENGWKGAWDEYMARQAVLRTHATSVSARQIYRYAKYDGNDPLKLVSIGRVFRNESIDYKHLAELHHSDGIIIGKGLSLANLIHTLKEFYARLGFEVRMKPSYFPFVEPGMEVTYYNEKVGDWIELCGSGVIRKEITRALGSRNTVLAWGAGLDRLAFNELDIGSLTELYRNDTDWLRTRKELGAR